MTTTYFKYLEHPNSQFVENRERVVKPIIPNWRTNLTFEEKLLTCGCWKGDKTRLFDDVKPHKSDSPRNCRKSSSLEERRRIHENYTFKYGNRESRQIANSRELQSRRRRYSSGKVPSCTHTQSKVDTLKQIMNTERRTKMLEIGNLYSINNRTNRLSEQKMNERKLEQIFDSKRKTEAFYAECLKNIKNLSHEVGKYYQSLEKELKGFSAHLNCNDGKQLSSLLSSSTYRVANLKSITNDDESGSNDSTTLSYCMDTRHYPSQQNLQKKKASEGTVKCDQMSTALLTAIEEGSKTKKENEKSLNCPAETSNSVNHVDKVDSDKRIFDVSKGSLNMKTKFDTSHGNAQQDLHVDLSKQQELSSSTLKNISFQIHKTSTFLSSEEILKKTMSIRRRNINNSNLETESSSLIDISENDSEGILNETVKHIINFSNS